MSSTRLAASEWMPVGVVFVAVESQNGPFSHRKKGVSAERKQVPHLIDETALCEWLVIDYKIIYKVRLDS